MRIVFMGTPEFAVPSLEILMQHQLVVAAVTAPDKPKGRGLQMTESAVKICAAKNNIPVLQPANLKSPEFIETLKSYAADLQVVAAFRMLPEAVWSMPRLGTFNLHASLLPDYRGAAPVNWAIINGEKETGLTTFLLQKDIDTGNILFQEKESIRPDDTAGTLYERLMHKGAKLVLKTAQAIDRQTVCATPQPVGQYKTAPKIFKETCEIDWRKSSVEIQNFVRGLSPYPCAWTTIQGAVFKVFACQTADYQNDSQTLACDNKNYLYLKSGDGWISITECQPQGKRRMTIQEFLRGHKISA